MQHAKMLQVKHERQYQFNLTMQSEQSRNCTLEFIDLYRRLPSLWNPKHEGYRSRERKVKAYMLLLEKYREIDPAATIDTMKKKINILRTNYRKEVAKVKMLGESTRTTMFYSALRFLTTMEVPEDAVQAASIVERPQSADQPEDEQKYSQSEAEGSTAQMSENGENAENDNDDHNNEVTDSFSEYEIVIAGDNDSQLVRGKLVEVEAPAKTRVWNDVKPVLSKKRINPVTKIKRSVKQEKRSRLSEQDEESKTIEATPADTSSNSLKFLETTSMDEEAAAIAKVWAFELRKMDERQQLFAKKAINDILLEGQLGTLHRHAVRIQI